MSQRRVQIILLCEDRQQEVFARHFLRKRGFVDQCRDQNLQENAPETLQAACGELKRLLPLLSP